MFVTVCLGSHQSQSGQPISIPGRAMNKQPSKESLKDKVKGIFGLGPPRPPSKQSDTKPSEFIITTDIIKVCGETLHVHTHARTHTQANSPYLSCFCGLTLHLFNFQELHPDCGLSNRVRMMNHVCDLAKTKKFEEVSMHRVSHCETAAHTIRFLCKTVRTHAYVSARSGGCMESCGGHADSRAATWGPTCCTTAAEGHYTGAGRYSMQKRCIHTQTQAM